MLADEVPGSAATDDEFPPLIEQLAAALMSRWGVEDDDQDAYDAACADGRVAIKIIREYLCEVSDEMVGAEVVYTDADKPARVIWLHTMTQVHEWLDKELTHAD